MFFGFFKSAWRFLVRIEVVSILILLVLLWVALGACFPQQPAGMDGDPERLDRWQVDIQARYGRLASLLATLGFFHFYRSPVFILVLSLLALSTLVCTLDRWRAVWRRAFHYQVCCPEATFQTGDQRASFTASEGWSPERISDFFARRGFKVRTQEAEADIHFRGDVNRLSPLATLLTHLGVLLLLVGALISAMLGWREEVVITPGKPAGLQHIKGLEFHYQDTIIQRYPDGRVAGYELRVLAKKSGGEMFPGSVRLNQPLGVDDVSIYLQGFEQSGDHLAVRLLVVHDPGYAVVILAGFLLLFGLSISFYFPHSCIYARARADGTISLAGRAERRAYTFERQFKELLADLENAGLKPSPQGPSPC